MRTSISRATKSFSTRLHRRVVRDNGSCMLQNGEVRNLRAASGLHSYRSLSLSLVSNLCRLVSMMLPIFFLFYSRLPSRFTIYLIYQFVFHPLCTVPAWPLQSLCLIVCSRPTKDRLCLSLIMFCVDISELDRTVRQRKRL